MKAPTAIEQAIAARIEAAGAITFAEFMDMALYGEGGYYADDELPIGGKGDYVTGSRSPLFAATTLRVLRALDPRLGGAAEFLEVGVGDARHLRHLAAMGRGGLYAHDRVLRPLPPGVEWLSDLDSHSIRGVVFSYELLDALPVHRLVMRSGELLELWVGLDDRAADVRFVWVEQPLSHPDLAELVEGVDLADGQIADVTPAWATMAQRLAGTLSQGLLITCDYGYPRDRLLDARIRMHGTLACYRKHTVHRNPLVDVGRQDLTAHVDFTAVQEAGEAAGLVTLGRLKLAEWLTAMGIFDQLREADRATRGEAQKLLDPAAMGSEIKVLIQARGDVKLADLGTFGPEL